MKAILLTLIITLISAFSLKAQHVTISEKKNRIAGESYFGYASKIAGKEDDIEEQWYRVLRTLGRLREEGNYLIVREAKLADFGDITFPLHSKLMASDSVTEVWITANYAFMPEDSLALVNEQLQTFLYNFTLTFYKGAAQKKVNEAQRAVDFIAKKHQKLKVEAEELTKDLQDNKEEIERLKQLLEKNELEHIVIEQKIIDNQSNRDSTLVDLERLKAIVLRKKEIKATIE